MCKESGVTVRLHTFVFDTLTENAGSDACRSLTAVCTASKSGKETFYAKYFIDATGDGDVCARSGAEFAKGNEQGLMQPMTMFALVSGPEYSEMVSLDNALEYSPGAGALPKVLLKEEICRAGITPSQKAPAMYHMFNNIYLLTVNHEYAKDGTNADSLTEATVSARDEINRITDALRAMGGKWQNLRLVSTASMIGVRESRRILGDYTVTKDHVREGTKFEDGLCNVTGGIDVHALTKNNPTGFETVSEDTCSHDYQLPLRACKVKGFQNLLTAGRCISGDFYAHASYRLTGNMSVLGQKIGTYAAQMVRCGK